MPSKNNNERVLAALLAVYSLFKNMESVSNTQVSLNYFYVGRGPTNASTWSSSRKSKLIVVAPVPPSDKKEGHSTVAELSNLSG